MFKTKVFTGSLNNIVKFESEMDEWFEINGIQVVSQYDMTISGNLIVISILYNK